MATDGERRHPAMLEPSTLLPGIVFAILGVIIGLELLTRVGITPNSSLIAAIAAIGLSRIPAQIFRRFRDLSRQNLMQTVISAATFGGANGILLPAGLLWLTGHRDLVPVMLVGACCGITIDALLIYRLFDTPLFPASGLWPAGVATAECLIAGDSGGRRAALLAVGLLAGASGLVLGIPMDVFGVCWIGNIWALFMFGMGLLVRGYALPVAGVDIDVLYVPHGVMIGAGMVALAQMGRTVLRARRAAESAGRILLEGYAAFAIAALLMAALAGLATSMPAARLLAFVLFAATAALVSEIVVGIAAMHSGWFPAFATALIFLLVGMALGFPPLPLAFLTGFAASTGPAFADMGYDLKAGWILRGEGADPSFERAGRRQQLIAELVGLTVAAIFVWLFHASYFERDLFPPWDRVASATIAAGASPALAAALGLWAIPGAAVQLIGGAARQLGVLFATGLLIDYPVAGWTAILSLLVRFALTRRYGEDAEGPMYVLAGGFIAGSALASFAAATLSLR